MWELSDKHRTFLWIRFIVTKVSTIHASTPTALRNTETFMSGLVKGDWWCHWPMAWYLGDIVVGWCNTKISASNSQVACGINFGETITIPFLIDERLTWEKKINKNHKYIIFFFFKCSRKNDYFFLLFYQSVRHKPFSGKMTPSVPHEPPSLASSYGGWIWLRWGRMNPVDLGLTAECRSVVSIHVT